jgi:hypothetical protein
MIDSVWLSFVVVGDEVAAGVTELPVVPADGGHGE